MSEDGQITRLLESIRQGEPEAFDRLFPLVYDALRQISRRQLRRRADATLRTTELVHEAYMKLVGSGNPNWRDRSHFFAVSARAMRQILVDHARRRNADKRGGDRERITFADREVRIQLRLDEVLAVDEALDRLDQLNARLRKVVECRFFGGMTAREIADVLGVSTRTVERDWTKARLFLHRELYPEAEDRP